MFCANLNDRSAWSQILTHHIVVKSLRWLEEMAAGMTLGDYPLGDNGFHANVHSYQTLLEADCLWESHEHTIDVQYVIDGEEIIRWMPINALKGKSKSISAQDRLEWDAPLFNTTAITMRPGMFALFMPGEAHCPKIALGLPTLIKKAVVKVPTQLLKN